MRERLLGRRAVIAHLAVFAAVSAVAVAFTTLALWVVATWAVIVAVHAGATWFRHFIGIALEGYVEAPPAQGVIVTGSLSSRVVLDYDRGTAEKTYGGGRRLVRWLYRSCFQAPFPYTSNLDALEAAMHRRTVIGLLTQYWFGRNLVAPVLEVRPTDDGRYTLVTELVRGTVPTNLAGAKSLLRELTGHFLDAGLPSWQVGYYNPRAIGNLIECDDGSFHIIDLESNLVTPFLPPGAIVRGIRRAQYPSFDDIDVPRLRAYLAARREALAAALGPEDTARLFAATDDYAVAQARWFAAEPRIPSRVLSMLFRLVDVPSWVGGVRRLAARGQGAGERFVGEGVDAWLVEGRITAEESRELRAAIADPEVALVLANLGAHLAITVPLRFPFGSLTRFGWTAGSRATAEWRALRGRAPATAARRVHTIPVMFATLLPSVGSMAYLLASPLRAHVALEVIAVDRLLRRIPFRLHARLHLAELTGWFARPKPPPFVRGGPRTVAGGIAVRLAAIAPRRRLAGAVVSANAGVLIVAAVIYQRDDGAQVFAERGLIATLNALELLLAGALGLLAFRLFWRDPAALRATPQERAGSFFWALSGLGLIVFGIDDFFSIHERVGRWVADHVGVLPLLTNNVDDLITLAYGAAGLVMLHVFRHELFAIRPASALYLFGVVAAAVMLLVDAYGRGPVGTIEFPVQVTAVGLLLLAHVAYYLRVRARTDVRAIVQTGDTVAPV